MHYPDRSHGYEIAERNTTRPAEPDHGYEIAERSTTQPAEPHHGYEISDRNTTQPAEPRHGYEISGRSPISRRLPDVEHDLPPCGSDQSVRSRMKLTVA